MSEQPKSHLHAGVPTAGLMSNLSKVEKILKSLMKFVSGKKIYADNNPTLAKFAEEFHSSFREFLEKEGELVLLIEQATIKWNDEVAYENQKREDSLAFLLYRDGIGEMTITQDVSEEELDRFVDIIKQEFHSTADEEDIVTKFWKADFKSITYRVLEDYLSSEFGDSERKESDSKPSALDFDDHEVNLPSLRDVGRIIIAPNDPLDSIDVFLKNLVKKSCPTGDEAEVESTFQSIVESTLKVSDAERSLFHEQLQGENNSDAIVEFIDSIIDFTLMSSNPTAVRDVINVTTRLLEYIISEHRMTALHQTLVLIKKFEEKQSIPESVAKICDDFVEMLCEDSLLLALSKDIEESSEKTSEILEYFSLIGKKTVPLLCELLQKVNGHKTHQEICDTLISVAGDDIPAVLNRLDIDKAEVAFDAVYIIREAKLHKVSRKIRELIHYPDKRVQAEVIKYLGELQEEEVLTTLFKALEDPDKTIRIKVLEALEDKNSPPVLEKVSELAFGRDIAQRSLDEQEVIFKVLGRVGNEETVEYIGKMMEKRHLLHFGKNRENKFLAIRALENICTKSSLRLLEKLAKDTNSLVQSRAKRAWQNLRNRMQAAKEETAEGFSDHER